MAEVAVFGVPDEQWGQRVCAAVVPPLPVRPATPTRALGRAPSGPMPSGSWPATSGRSSTWWSTRCPGPPPARSRRLTCPDLSTAPDQGARRRGAVDPAVAAVGDTGVMSPVDPGPPIATVNPATGELIESFEPFDAAAVEARLATPRPGPRPWAASTFTERSRLLITAAELLEGELPDIAQTVTTEMGKPFAQAKGEVAKCASGFRWFAEHAEALLADRGGAPRRLAGPRHLPTPGRGVGHHAVELPAVAGGPVPRPGHHGRQCRPAQARAERAPHRPSPRGPVPPLRRPRRRSPDPADRYRPGPGPHHRPPGGRGHPDRERGGRPRRGRPGRGGG